MIDEYTFDEGGYIMEELTNLELTREDLEEMTTEELVDLKVELEELLMQCEELLEDSGE